MFGNTLEASKLIKAGADVNEIGAYGSAPLAMAAGKGNMELVSLLIQAGARVTNTNVYGNKPLISAASWASRTEPTPSLEIVEFLLKSGADINEREIRGENAIFWTAAFGRDDLAKFLIRAGIDVNATTCDGETPLMKAATMGHTDVVKSLITAGASPWTRTNSGHTAFDRARHNKHQEVLNALNQSKTTQLFPPYDGVGCKFSLPVILMKQWSDKHLPPISYKGWQQVHSSGLGFIFLPCVFFLLFALVTHDKVMLYGAIFSPILIVGLLVLALLVAASLGS